MRASVQIYNVQHLNNFSFELDLSSKKLTCIVGKNGTGKTTLVKAFRNVARADAFASTSAISMIFSPESKIEFQFGDFFECMHYSEKTTSLEPGNPFPESVKSIVHAELPVPYGERFNFFQKISGLDNEIRRAILLEEYAEPRELRDFLLFIYGTNKFDALVEVSLKGESYFCLALDNGRYVREDYFSSGEYFLISLYRRIKSRCELIVIDEIDISLDAAAQVKLVAYLRTYCQNHGVNILFTTHSFTIMQKLLPEELYFMEEIEGKVVVEQRSYNYIASILFGFTGRDKFIITEDQLLADFIHFFLDRHCNKIDCLFKIIPVGGGPQVVRIIEKNEQEFFFTTPDNVIGVLDGDQEREGYWKKLDGVFLIPFDSVEKFLLQMYLANYKDFPSFSDSDFKFEPKGPKPDKRFYDCLINDGKSKELLFDYICDKLTGEKINGLSMVFNKFFSI